MVTEDHSEEALCGARRRARQTLEAIRLGVVPASDVAAYTVGRDDELSLIDVDLGEVAERGGAVRAFLGDYGVGKTHLLELLQQKALQRNYLVARAMLDAWETSASHPGRVYRALVRGLRYPERPYEEGAGLGRLLQKALATPGALARFGADRPASASLARDLEQGAHLYLTPALRYAAALEARRATADGASLGERPVGALDPVEAEGGGVSADLIVDEAMTTLVGWLEGQATVSNQALEKALSRCCGGSQGKLYSLQDYRPWARIYAYLISGLSALAREVGYEGLVVVLDEAEFYAVLSDENRAHARRLFKALALASVGQEEGTLPFDAAELDPGGAGVQRALPARYGQHPGLVTVLAMTPHREGMSALRAALPWRRIRELSALERGHYVSLATRVTRLYTRAYPSARVPPQVIEPLGQVIHGLLSIGYIGNARQAVKFIVEFLDVVRAHPGRVVQVIRDLQSLLTF